MINILTEITRNFILGGFIIGYTSYISSNKDIE